MHSGRDTRARIRLVCFRPYPNRPPGGIAHRSTCDTAAHALARSSSCAHSTCTPSDSTRCHMRWCPLRPPAPHERERRAARGCLRAVRATPHARLSIAALSHTRPLAPARINSLHTLTVSSLGSSDTLRSARAAHAYEAAATLRSTCASNLLHHATPHTDSSRQRMHRRCSNTVQPNHIHRKREQQASASASHELILGSSVSSIDGADLFAPP